MAGPELKAKLTLDNSGFNGSIAQARRAFDGWARDIKAKAAEAAQATKESETAWAGVTGAIVGAVTALGAFVANTLKSAGAIQDLADRTGMTAEQIQNLSQQAENAGTNMDAIATAREKLAKAMNTAGGSDDMVKTFERLGVTLEDLKRGNLDEIFNTIGATIKGTKLEAQNLADILEVFGKGSGKLIPFFKSGKENVDPITGQNVARLDATGDAMSTMWARIKNKARNIAAPVITGTVDMLTGGEVDWRAKQAAKYSKQEKEAVFNAQAIADEKEKAKQAEKDAKKEAKEKLELEKEEFQALKKRKDAESDLYFAREIDAKGKIAFLKNQNKEIEKTINLKDKIDTYEKRENILRNMQKIEEIQRDEAKRVREMDKPAEDSLTRIGNFLGSNFNTGRSQVALLEGIKVELQEIKRNTGARTGASYP